MLTPKTKFYLFLLPKNQLDLSDRLQQINDSMEKNGYIFKDLRTIPNSQNALLLIFNKVENQNEQKENIDQ